jgi:hypothetical protein
MTMAQRPLSGHRMLQEVINSFGGTSDQSQKNGKKAEAGLLSPRQSTASSLPPAAPPTIKTRRPRRQTTIRTVAEMLRSWETYQDVDKKSGSASLCQDNPTAVHKRCIEGLVALKRLETELDLNFKVVSSLPEHGLDASSSPRKCIEKKGANDIEEIALQLELQGALRKNGGRAQSLILRSPMAWEIVPTGGSSCSRPLTPNRRSVTPSTRACTPCGEGPANDTLAIASRSATPVAGECSQSLNSLTFGGPTCDNTVRAIGDAGHAMLLELRERSNETLLIRRVRPNGGFSGGRLWTPTEGLPRLQATNACDEDVEDASLFEEDPLALLSFAETQCLRLEQTLALKLSEHSKELSVLANDANGDSSPTKLLALTSTPNSVEVPSLSSSGPRSPMSGMRAQGLSIVTSSDPSNDRFESYLRDFRTVFRLIGPVLPSATRMLETSLKGLVLALDAELHTAHGALSDLQAKVDILSSQIQGTESVRSENELLKSKNESLQKKLQHAETLRNEEVATLSFHIDTLKNEVKRLTPEEGSMQAVSTLIDVCENLLEDMQIESAKQNKILEELSDCTSRVVYDSQRAADDSAKISAQRPGRIVELPNGEIILRSFDVVEQATQVTELDLLKVDIDAPIRYRTLTTRTLLAAFQSREVKKMRSEELSVEIDKLYAAKIVADSEADSAGLPRAQLSDFIIEYYLDSIQSVGQAQERLSSIMSSISAIERASAKRSDMPLKIQLFARFLEYCDFEQVLPLSVLNIALQAKRLCQAQVAKGDPSLQKSYSSVSRDSGRSRGASVLGGGNSVQASSDQPLSVAIAWDSSLKALPHGGSPEARKELFAHLSKFAEVQGTGADGAKVTSQFYVLLLILHDRLKKEAAPKLRELVHRVETKGQATVEDFKEALHDAGLLGVEDSVWRPRLAHSFVISEGVILNESVVLDHFGGGAIHRMPRGSVSEAQMMTAVAEAFVADSRERCDNYRRLFNRHNSKMLDPRSTSISFSDFKFLLQSADPSITAAFVRNLFCSAVEVGRSCFQYDGDACPVVGTLTAASSGIYGGDTVTLQLLHTAMLKSYHLKRDQAHNTTTTSEHDRSSRGHNRGAVPLLNSSSTRPSISMVPKTPASATNRSRARSSR